MSFLPILLAILLISPGRGDADLLFKTQLSYAIAEGTDDPKEQEELRRIAWYESGYRRSVASCKVKGDGGKSHGTFQVQPRSPEDRADACGTLQRQVAVALRFIRRSHEVCAHLEPRDQLSLYTTGRCIAWQKEARERWGAP